MRPANHILGIGCCLALGAAILAGAALGGDALDSWKWRSPLPQGNPLLGLAAGDGKYVVVGDHGTILISSNTVDWQPVAVGTIGRFYGVAYHAGQFVAVGEGIWTSTNALDWTQRRAEYLYGITWANGYFVAVGWSGSILTSVDGITWLDRISETSVQLNAISYANGLFVVAGGSFTNSALLTSTDAIHWTNRTFTSDVLTGVAYGNGTFAAVGYDFYGNVSVSLTSPDGANWTRNVVPQSWYTSGVCFDQGKFVLAGNGGIYTSTNGIDWVNQYAEPPNGLLAVASLDASFVAVGGAGAVITSPDGTNWTRHTVGSWHAFYAVVEGNGTLVAVGNRGATATSTNGVNWVHRNLGANTLFSGVTFGHGKFVAVGSVFNPFVNVQTVFASSDGVTWNQQTVAIPGYLSDVIFADGTFVATAGDGFGGQGGVMTSTDGQNWILQNVPTNGLYRIGYGKGTFVATGRNGVILTSTNRGSNWTAQNSGTTQHLGGIGFGDAIFVTGDSYGNILTSTNGIAWSSQNINGNNVVNGVTYGNGTFIMVGNGTVLTSTNAIHWKARTLPSRDKLTAVVYAGSAFVTVGEWGMILQSGYFGPPLMGRTSLSADKFQFSVTAEKGQRYRLQTSTNLHNNAAWTDWLVYTNDSDVAWFQDSSVGSSRRFYRAVVP